jgi:hypothetical protein
MAVLDHAIDQGAEAGAECALIDRQIVDQEIGELLGRGPHPNVGANLSRKAGNQERQTGEPFR